MIMLRVAQNCMLWHRSHVAPANGKAPDDDAECPQRCHQDSGRKGVCCEVCHLADHQRQHACPPERLPQVGEPTAACAAVQAWIAHVQKIIHQFAAPIAVMDPHAAFAMCAASTCILHMADLPAGPASQRPVAPSS